MFEMQKIRRSAVNRTRRRPRGNAAADHRFRTGRLYLVTPRVFPRPRQITCFVIGPSALLRRTRAGLRFSQPSHLQNRTGACKRPLFHTWGMGWFGRNPDRSAGGA